jgi:prepilin-type N-terminal cleavage/methylation domain-containing protein
MNKKGFTLIELVMVIVILAILAAVAIPVFQNLRKEAKKATCAGNLGGIRSAVCIYYSNDAITGSGGQYPKCPEQPAVDYAYDSDTGITQCTYTYTDHTGN